MTRHAFVFMLPYALALAACTAPPPASPTPADAIPASAAPASAAPAAPSGDAPAAMSEAAVMADCRAVVPEGFALQAIAAGSVEVTVKDAAGKPIAGIDVFMNGPFPASGYQLQCIPGAHLTTGVDGVARGGRLKVGSYKVWVDGDPMGAPSVVINANQTTKVDRTFTPRAASPMP